MGPRHRHTHCVRAARTRGGYRCWTGARCGNRCSATSETPLLLRWIVIHRRSVDQAARLFQAGAPSGAEGDGIAREQHQLARRLCPSRRRRRRPLGCTLVQPRGLLALPRRVRRRRPQLFNRRLARLPESSLASGYESRSADVRERSHGQAFLWPCVLQPSQS